MPTYACNLPTYVRHILPSRLIAVSLSSSLVVSLRPAGRPHYLHVQYTFRCAVRRYLPDLNELHEIAACKLSPEKYIT